MEALDQLKNDWKKNKGNFPRFSEKDIYAMLHKKSSSIVKWILVISLLEFVLYLSLSLFMSDSKTAKGMETYTPRVLNLIMNIIGYAIIIYFIYQFYINYRKIKTTDNVKNLMKTILHTRKTVSNYIIANITFMIISMATVFVLFFNNDPEWLGILHKSEEQGNEGYAYLLFLFGAIVGMGLFVLFFWLFYKLIYGLLLKRLHRNYQELKKIDF